MSAPDARTPHSSDSTLHLDILALKRFHVHHFPAQPLPSLDAPRSDIARETTLHHSLDSTRDDDALGYYEDGVKRTLTDQQVKMFRHSEIQRLLKARRIARENEERRKRKEKAGHATPASYEGKRRRFRDEPKTNNHVDSLLYEDEPQQDPQTKETEKKFLWPVLNQS